MNNIVAYLLVVMSVPLVGCGQTRYSGYDATSDQGSVFSRTVEFELTGTFYDDPPTCAVVMPFSGVSHDDPRALVVEESLARQLSGRFRRVIGPHERRRLVRDLAVDLADQRDRRTFAQVTKCGFLLESKPWGEGPVFALFWTQERVGMEVRLVRGADDVVVWKARHIAKRSEGGVPLSPLSAIYNLVSVGSFSIKQEVPVSLVDDATRRLAQTLPDTRNPGVAVYRGRR